MNRDELEDSWRRTRKRFERAVAVLVVGSDAAPASSETFQENLDHNELELALDDLEELGGRATQPPCPEYRLVAPGQRISAHVGSRKYAEAVVLAQVDPWRP